MAILNREVRKQQSNFCYYHLQRPAGAFNAQQDVQGAKKFLLVAADTNTQKEWEI